MSTFGVDVDYQAAYRERNREKRRAYTAQWQREHPDEYKAMMRRAGLRRHKLTVESFDELLASQGGVCAICGGVNASGQRLHVDHDHRTGRLRALLCSNCNRGIGHLKDDPDVLRAAATYVESYRRII